MGSAVAMGVLSASVVMTPAVANDEPVQSGTTPGEPQPVAGDSGTVGATYTCTPQLDIRPKAALWDGKEGYSFQVVLDRDTCPAIDLDKKHFAFTCQIQLHRDGAWVPYHSASGGLNSIAAGDPDLLICRTWVSKAALSTADSNWTARVWASMKDQYPESVHVNDMYRQKTFTVRSDGTIIYRIAIPFSG